jgi:cytoskeletal protein RodZ
MQAKRSSVMDESIGSYLKREREFRQISLAEVAAATRINPAALEAIEKDDFAELPGKIFVRGYLKAYAKHVGLDAADVLLRYEHWLDKEEGEKVAATGLGKKWHWEWKYLWMASIISAIIALAAFLSSR